MNHSETVLRIQDIELTNLRSLFSAYALTVQLLPAHQRIPGSFWGDSEAGLVGKQLLVRQDTPVHSAFHEACHYICMDEQRRTALDTDAGGDYDEENAVCYLQITLADYLPGFDQARMLTDMDTWGYSFRLGSAQAWFEEDADDAREWLLTHNLIDSDNRPTWRLRA